MKIRRKPALDPENGGSLPFLGIRRTPLCQIGILPLVHIALAHIGARYAAGDAFEKLTQLYFQRMTPFARRETLPRRHHPHRPPLPHRTLTISPPLHRIVDHSL